MNQTNMIPNVFAIDVLNHPHQDHLVVITFDNMTILMTIITITVTSTIRFFRFLGATMLVPPVAGR